MKKSIKIPLIILCVILSLILILALVAGGIYLYSETVRFDHRDCSSAIAPVEYELPEGYSINYPFYGNSLALSGSDGRSYALIFGSGGEKNIRVYNAVNDPIDMWIDYLAERYKRRVNTDYTVEQDSKTITVVLTGNVTDDEGQIIPVGQKFIFNIENASPDNLPQWTNKDEMSADYKEYLDYTQKLIDNPEKAVMPDWLAQRY